MRVSRLSIFSLDNSLVYFRTFYNPLFSSSLLYISIYTLALFCDRKKKLLFLFLILAHSHVRRFCRLPIHAIHNYQPTFLFLHNSQTRKTVKKNKSKKVTLFNIFFLEFQEERRTLSSLLPFPLPSS